jgi:DnaJ-class molecular chaperone
MAEAKFMEIQAACNLLSEHRKSKSKLNEKSDEF